MVPLRYSQDPALGRWVKKQRERKGNLSEDQRAKLDKLNFEWQGASARRDRIWEQMYEQLVMYRNQHGTCQVPFPTSTKKGEGSDMSSSSKEQKKLAIWVQEQGTQYREKRIPKERLAKLQAIGFVWPIRKSPSKATPKEEPADLKDGQCVPEEINHVDKKDERWYEQYLKLADFERRHKNCMVPQEYATDRTFGLWVAKQRTLYNRGVLGEDRMHLLRELGFEWNPLEQSFQKRYEELKAFKEKHGNLSLLNSGGGGTKETRRLYDWAYRQRLHYRRNALNSKHVAMLRELGFDLDKGMQIVAAAKGADSCKEDGLPFLEPEKKEDGQSTARKARTPSDKVSHHQDEEAIQQGVCDSNSSELNIPEIEEKLGSAAAAKPNAATTKENKKRKHERSIPKTTPQKEPVTLKDSQGLSEEINHVDKKDERWYEQDTNERVPVPVPVRARLVRFAPVSPTHIHEAPEHHFHDAQQLEALWYKRTEIQQTRQALKETLLKWHEKKQKKILKIAAAAANNDPTRSTSATMETSWSR